MEKKNEKIENVKIKVFRMSHWFYLTKLQQKSEG